MDCTTTGSRTDIKRETLKNASFSLDFGMTTTPLSKIPDTTTDGTVKEIRKTIDAQFEHAGRKTRKMWAGI